MGILVHEDTKAFHLFNDAFSYVMQVLPGGHLGQVYVGKRVHDRADFSYYIEGAQRSHMAYEKEDGLGISFEAVRREFPSYGNGDFRQGAISVLQENGSRVTDFVYEGYEVLAGKPGLPGLPATYVEDEKEADTLIIRLCDQLSGVKAELLYTVYADRPVLTRSVRLVNEGTAPVVLERCLSLCLDLPDADYDYIQFSGSWARERYPMVHHLNVGTHTTESLRGHSSHQNNPFIILKRPETNEDQGEAFGFTFVYSGNFLASAQVDTYGVTRVLMGIHPECFAWKLTSGEAFQAPEVVLSYTDQGLNGLSQTLHSLFQKRLCRGQWRDTPRPILINNWEATYFSFNEDKLVEIAKKAKECGVELFVLDDGWFGARRLDNAGLGDWVACKELLPNGIKGLSEKIDALGMRFGLWFEPEMVNPDSDLYRAHPDWAFAVPGRVPCLGRHQYVLDFSRKEVVDCIYEQMAKILRESKISYIKWDMNRSMTDVFSQGYPADQQGEVFHRYILGVYDLYDRLTREFPHILFESCAGGGARFDAGLLYYAPQAWTSDDTDALERMKIQYGTSFGYPVSSMGSHVSAVPNHQVSRSTPLKTRADVAYFGTYGYELDLNLLSDEEQAEVREYTQFMKDHRQLLQFGTFYRLKSPFEGNEVSWMSVSEDKEEAIVGYYQMLAQPNMGFKRLPLKGLDPERRYEVIEHAPNDPLPPHAALYGMKDDGSTDGKRSHGIFYGDELMHAGLVTSDAMSGKIGHVRQSKDFASTLFLLKVVD